MSRALPISSLPVRAAADGSGDESGEDLDPEEFRERLAFEFLRRAPHLPGAGDLGVASAAVEAWPHQLRVVRRAVEHFPRGFLFCDEVGLGKTIEAGLALRQLWISGRVRRVLILVPRAVLRQWQEELHEKLALDVVRYEGDRFVGVGGRQVGGHRGAGNPWDRHPLLLASTQLARRRDRRRQILAAEPWDLVIVDEAHHARRRNPEGDGFQPNRLLALLGGAPGDGPTFPGAGGLAERSRCLWLLTATPMQIHPVELRDLLGLLGLGLESDDGPAPWREQVFRHTRALLRSYQRRGLLRSSVPERRPENVWIDLGDEARGIYRRIDAHLARFYRRYEAERRGLGFVMTVYRRRLTSSFAAIRRSLLRRRERLLAGEADEAETAGNRSLFAPLEPRTSGRDALDPAHAEELERLDELVGDVERLRDDPKVERLRRDLRRILEAEDGRDRVIVFTQYADTLDHLREELAGEWRIACWSGRGGERREGDRWVEGTKEELKRRFGAGEIDVLLATEAASEGLNLQSCGVLVNFDMPWNPMRVEQRIGRIDRIGQRHDEVRVLNYFYADTVEAEVYRRLADRIGWFQEVVGPLQPILHDVGEAIGALAMERDGRRQHGLDEAVGKLGARLAEDHDELPELEMPEADDPAAEGDAKLRDVPVTPRQVERLFVGSRTLGSELRPVEEDPVENPGADGVYELRLGRQPGAARRRVTFRPEVYESHPYSTTLLTWGQPLFHRLVDRVPPPPSTEDDPRGLGLYASRRPSPVALFLAPGPDEAEIRSLENLDRFLRSARAHRRWRGDEESRMASIFSRARRSALAERERVEALRRDVERRSLEAGARRVLRRLAHLELVAAESPGLFDEPLRHGFGREVVSALRRHGPPCAELLERLETPPEVKEDDDFYKSARHHRPGWRETRRRALLDEAERIAERWRRLERAEEEAKRSEEPTLAGFLERTYFSLPAAEDEADVPEFSDAADVEPFADAVPVYESLEDAARRRGDALAEGRHPDEDVAAFPEDHPWHRPEGRVTAARGRFVLPVEDDALAPELPNGAWVLVEHQKHPPKEGDLVLLRLPGRGALIRRWRPEGLSGDGEDAESRLVLEASEPGRTVVLDDPEPESVQVIGRVVGRV